MLVGLRRRRTVLQPIHGHNSHIPPREPTSTVLNFAFGVIFDRSPVCHSCSKHIEQRNKFCRVCSGPWGCGLAQQRLWCDAPAHGQDTTENARACTSAWNKWGWLALGTVLSKPYFPACAAPIASFCARHDANSQPCTLSVRLRCAPHPARSHPWRGRDREMVVYKTRMYTRSHVRRLRASLSVCLSHSASLTDHHGRGPAASTSTPPAATSPRRSAESCVAAHCVFTSLAAGGTGHWRWRGVGMRGCGLHLAWEARVWRGLAWVARARESYATPEGPQQYIVLRMPRYEDKQPQETNACLRYSHSPGNCGKRYGVLWHFPRCATVFATAGGCNVAQRCATVCNSGYKGIPATVTATEYFRGYVPPFQNGRTGVENCGIVPEFSPMVSDQSTRPYGQRVNIL
eukprot:gene25674-biopygen18014